MPAESELIVSVSGIRGVVGKNLTPQTALAFASAMGTCTQGGTVVVSRDGRPSGRMLGHAVISGLLSTGCNVVDLGVAPTPTVGIALIHLQAVGAIQITASHNPSEWNGLKLFGAGGRVLSPEQGQRIKTLYESGEFQTMGWKEMGVVADCKDAFEWHQAKVTTLLQIETIRSKKFAVLVDANGGAGGPLAVSLLELLGCEIHTVGCNADGEFAHLPEPLLENLSDICPLVKDRGADIGFVLDPDADRLALIDEHGTYIGEELTLALAVMYRLCQQKGPVVINMSSSRLVIDICNQHGVECHRSAVGEANVIDKMQQLGAVIGGEGNGGVIDPRVGLVRDPFIGMGLILNLLAETGQSLSELVAELPKYHIVKTKHYVERGKLLDLYNALQLIWADAAANHDDGLRLDWPDRWVHVRPSNTEPIVRIIAEAPTAIDAARLCQEAAGQLNPT